jgi:hypothetical protein
MESLTPPSLSAQLQALRIQHRSLDTEIIRLQDFPYSDQFMLRRLKKQKLRVKENIELLHALLIPDLNA